MKTLGDLLDRAADILGTDREFRLRFTRASLVSYINQGCLLLRSAVGDDWFQVDVPYTANVGTYTWPLEMMNPIRVAYRDRGLRSRPLLGIVGQDSRWSSHTSSEPASWTADGLSQDQFMIWPAPIATSPEPFTFIAAASGGISSSKGLGVRFSDATGQYSARADPANPTWNENRGIIVRIDNHTIRGSTGTVVATQKLSDHLTIWGVRRPAVIEDDAAAVPVKNALQLAPLWYMLYRVYSEEADHYNRVLMGWYRERWNAAVETGANLAADPLPWQIHRLGAGGLPSEADMLIPRFNSYVYLPDGSTIDVQWPAGEGG